MSDKALKILEEMPPEITSSEIALEMCPDAIQTAYKNIDEVAHDMTDQELENALKPTQVDRLLKIKFWQEVERSQKENRLKVKAMNIYQDVCSKKYFYFTFLKDQDRVSYLFRKPYSYEDKANELIEFAIGRLRNEALTANIIFADSGHLDSKAAKIILEIIQYMEARTRGPLIQKHQIESKSMHMNVNVNEKEVGAFDVQQELKNVRMQIEKAKGVALVDGLPERMKDAELVENSED